MEVNMSVLELMEIIEADESIRNFQSRWRKLRELLETQAAQQREQAFQPPHGHVFMGGKCECGEQVPLPPFARR